MGPKTVTPAPSLWVGSAQRARSGCEQQASALIHPCSVLRLQEAQLTLVCSCPTCQGRGSRRWWEPGWKNAIQGEKLQFLTKFCGQGSVECLRRKIDLKVQQWGNGKKNNTYKAGLLHIWAFFSHVLSEVVFSGAIHTEEKLVVISMKIVAVVVRIMSS